MSDNDKGINSSGVFQWFFQRISGVFLLLALLTHFWILHFFPPEHGVVTYENVMARLQHPLWKAFDMLFLLLAIYHGMNGIMIVIHDYIKNSGWRMLAIGLLWIGALYLLTLGSLTILGLKAGG